MENKLLDPYPKMFALLQGVAFGGVSISDDVELAKKSWVTAGPDGGNLYAKGEEVQI